MATKVRNINGTAQAACPCGAWLKHWEKFSGVQAMLCGERTCGNRATVGAHVQLAVGSDGTWYIIPFCDVHNKHTGELEIYSAYPLVRASKEKTCG
jgi:hypothetical protein